MTNLLPREQSASLAAGTDFLNDQGDVYAVLAELLELGGKREEAFVALEGALARYERKGVVISAERVLGKLADLRSAASAERG